MLSPIEVKVAGREIKQILVAQKSPAEYCIPSHLISRGYEVQCSTSFEETIRALRRGAIHFQPFQVLILDEDLPGQRTSIRALRDAAGNRNLKVILLSANISNHGFFSEVDRIISSPICEKEFDDALAQMLDLRPVKVAPDAPPKILIVEDDSLSLELMKILLTKNGCDVALASSGMEAIKMCRDFAFDLIFMDLQMPEMDGFVTASRIREAEAGRHAPIVALTASNLSRCAYENLSTEFARILTKPFQIQTILETIEEFTGKQCGSKEKALAKGANKVIDIQAALPHFGLDKEQYSEILMEFQMSLPGRIEEMEMASQSGDMKRLALRAHSLKGVAANVGAMKLSALSARLEDVDTQTEVQPICETLEELRAAINEFQETAQNAIQEMGAETTQPMRET